MRWLEGDRGKRTPCSIRGMHTVLEVVVDVTVPVVVGLGAFAILAAGLGYVRQIGKGRPHAK